MDWRHEGDALQRDYEFKDFAAAMWFVNRVAELAEQANHHPDILVHGYNRVRLTLASHDAGGVTERDHALAAAIDELWGAVAVSRGAVVAAWEDERDGPAQILFGRVRASRIR